MAAVGGSAGDGGDAAVASPGPLEPPPRPPLRARLSRWLTPPEHSAPLLGVLLVVGLTACLSIPLSAGGASLVPGLPSPRDFEAPRPLVYDSAVRTEEAREAAAERVAPVYTIDRALVDAQLARVRDVMLHVGLLRQQPETAETATSKRRWFADIPELALLAPAQVDLMLGLGPKGSLDAEAWQQVQSEVVLVVAQTMRQQVRDDNRAAVTEQLIEKVDPRIEATEAQLVADIAARFVAPNTTLDAELTRSRREAARDATAVTAVSYARGETIAREGERLTLAQIEAIEEAGLSPGAFSWRDVLAMGLIVSALVLVLAAALARLHPGYWWRTRPLALIVLLVLAFTFGARFVVAAGEPLLVLAYPAAAVGMAVAVLLGMGTGLLASILLALVVGLVGGPHLDTTCYVFIGSLAGAVALGRVDRLKAFLIAAAAVAAANLAVSIGFELIGPALDLGRLPALAGMALVNAALSAGLAWLGIVAAGALFGVTTSIQLLELMRPDHPLLHELQLKAPGTYQHSIVLSNLAEAAATAIGADALLTRVGAYYHDIGKSLRPYFFVENQMAGINPHEGLDPATSARIIIEHVPEGAELARRHGLPEAVIDFIWQHQGTLRAEYFYRTAVAQAGEDAVDEAAFSYPGPRPQSRETALLMLADATEAKVRAESPHSVDEIDAIVEDIIHARLDAGQLDDSDLTLRDLRRIRRAFVQTLRSMYHPRVQYPAGIEPVRRPKPMKIAG